MVGKRSGRAIMWRLLRLVRPLAGYMALAVLCGVAGFACATALPTLATRMALCVATGAPAPFSLSIGAACGVLVLLAVVRGALHYAEQTCNHFIAFKLLAHVRDLVFGALRRLAPAKLAGANKGALIAAVTADTELLEVFFAHTVSPVLIACAMALLMICYVWKTSWLMALCALGGYVAIGVVVPLMSAQRANEAGREVRERSAALSGFVLDGLRGLEELLQFGAGQRRLAELDERSRDLSESQREIADASALTQAATSALICGVSMVVLLVGQALAAAGIVDARDALVASVAVFSSFGPFVALANLGASLQPTIAAGGRVLDILDEEPAVAENVDGTEPAFHGAAAQDVSFAYRTLDEQGEQTVEQVLNGVFVEVDKGQVVGICGPSGSGKSTLLRLFMRYWDVDDGLVSVSGEPISAIRTSTLRSMESLVEQDTHLFHDSIRDNLLVAKPDATQDELEAACRAASVHDFISSLPKGYDTMVGELGDTLSDGQRQRLGLARAFLHDAPFLLLDEPTSSVDALNEGAILRSIEQERGRRTVLLVSHRASTMAIADKTYTIDCGSVS